MTAITTGTLTAWTPQGGVTNLERRTTAGEALYRTTKRAVWSFFPGSGLTTVSGTAKLNGSAAKRRIILMQQNAPWQVLDSMMTTDVGGTFSFTDVPPGSYIVIDIMTDNSRQALVYDWVVSG